MNETAEVLGRGKIEEAAKVDDLVGIKPVNKIDIKITSFAPRIDQPAAAKGRTVK